MDFGEAIMKIYIFGELSLQKNLLFYFIFLSVYAGVRGRGVGVISAKHGISIYLQVN